jgi:formylglycine-generating enzyme
MGAADGSDGSHDASARPGVTDCLCDVYAGSDGEDRRSTDAETAPASCQADASGVTRCGAEGDSCCTSPAVTGGTYDRTYMTSAGVTSGDSDPATVSSLHLDQYLVTVGRFRGFVSAWKAGAGYVPPPGSGKHAHLNGGRGLANSGALGAYEPGWSASDDANVTPTGTALGSCGAFSTWTVSATPSDDLPINCVTWAEAYAFCIWDGGFLPSEAEWEYAAAGGSEQLEFPWGEAAPGGANAYAIYGNGASECYYPTGALTTCTGVANIAPVGTATLGAARWGQLDMGGQPPPQSARRPRCRVSLRADAVIALLRAVVTG